MNDVEWMRCTFRNVRQWMKLRMSISGDENSEMDVRVGVASIVEKTRENRFRTSFVLGDMMRDGCYGNECKRE